MPYYHATWASNVDAILRDGLGGSNPSTRNFDGVEDGVYLCVSPVIALSFLIEAYAELGVNAEMAPPQALAAMRVFVVDDSRLDNRRMGVDPNIERRDLTVLYKGIIDVAGMPILTADDITPRTEPQAVGE